MQLNTSGGPGRFLRPRQRRAARLDPRPGGVGRRAGGRAHRDHGRRQRARALEGGSEEAGARAEGAQAHHGDVDEALGGRGVHRWRSRSSPPTRIRERGWMSLREYEDFYYDACLVTDGDPVTAWQRQSDQVRQLASWIEGKDEVRSRPRDRHHPRGRAPLDPCVGEHNMPDGEFFTGPVEDSVNGEIAFSFPASYGGRTVSGVRSASRTAVDALGGERARTSCSRCSTRTWALAGSASSASAPTSVSRRARRRFCSTRRSAGPCTWRRHELSRDRGTNSSAVHWDMVCDLRAGGSITVDGVELQRRGFLV